MIINISACESLKNKFAESKGGTIRLLNVTIENGYYKLLLKYYIVMVCVI